MSAKKKVPVKTIVTILPNGTITIKKLELDPTATEQIMIKSEAS